MRRGGGNEGGVRGERCRRRDREGVREGGDGMKQSWCPLLSVCLQEKSKLDWEHFKEEEGLEHELSQQRKDG